MDNSSGQKTTEVDLTYDMYGDLIGRTVKSYSGGTLTSTTASESVYDLATGQLDLTFNGSGSLTNRYLYGPVVDQVLAQEDVSSVSTPGTTLWLASDNQGSIDDVWEYGVGLVDQISYSDFGAITSQTNSSYAPTFGYDGSYTDPLTGLQWHNDPTSGTTGRWYSTSAQRWMQPDPTGLAPDSNPNRYVGNDPMNETDPSGLAAAPISQAGNAAQIATYADDLGIARQRVSEAYQNAMYYSQNDWFDNARQREAANQALAVGNQMYGQIEALRQYLLTDPSTAAAVLPQRFGDSWQSILQSSGGFNAALTRNGHNILIDDYQRSGTVQQCWNPLETVFIMVAAPAIIAASAASAAATAASTPATEAATIAAPTVIDAGADVAANGGLMSLEGVTSQAYFGAGLSDGGEAVGGNGFNFAADTGAGEQAGLGAGVRSANPTPAAPSATDLLQLNKQLASAEQIGQGGTAMAGAGTNTPIRVANELAAQYGGQAADYAKMGSSSYTASDGVQFETHWYQNVQTGEQFEFKTKITAGAP
ncbi:MAG TPA: RHS repeat-associated core domain-containing protein [Pirellulales bacterium]|nr:RHS repeat-associated core domain-containing protein [Pirellulales bacterium]